MSKGPTERQLVILRAIVDFQQAHGFGPGIRDICRAVSITSLRGAAVHLDALQRKGLLIRGEKARSIIVTAAGRAALNLPDDPSAELREIKTKLAAYRGLRMRFDCTDPGPARREIAVELARVRNEMFGMIGEAEVKA